MRKGLVLGPLFSICLIPAVSCTLKNSEVVQVVEWEEPESWVGCSKEELVLAWNNRTGRRVSNVEMYGGKDPDGNETFTFYTVEYAPRSGPVIQSVDPDGTIHSQSVELGRVAVKERVAQFWFDDEDLIVRQWIRPAYLSLTPPFTCAEGN